PAFAEDTTPMSAEPPAATDPANPPAEANPPATPPAAAAEPATPAPAAAVASTDLTFVPQQAADQQLVSAWISKSVYNPQDETLGDVNDVVISSNGHVDAVVIGVGGFLGIGEKNVAVPVDKITATTDADGRVKLALNATKDQLKAAPEFVTLAEQQAKARSEAPAAEAPAAPATPAPAQ
ncbi:MAG: PRC-barrel domain-containing protein, partial [Rhizobiales bacterium]|nr:PRC-barrel domain-containing protein [Hyphomicrobiales bacterium]